MISSKFFFLLFLIGSSIGILEYFGVFYDLFWILPWYDRVLHVLGGIFVALILSLFIPQEALPKKFFSAKFFLSFFATMLVALFWEWYELRTGVTFVSRGGYKIDAISDIFFALIGFVGTYHLLQKNSS